MRIATVRIETELLLFDDVVFRECEFDAYGFEVFCRMLCGEAVEVGWVERGIVDEVRYVKLEVLEAVVLLVGDDTWMGVAAEIEFWCFGSGDPVTARVVFGEAGGYVVFLVDSEFGFGVERHCGA
jgi:hypothetical protein